jgi:hypothetical protein
MTYFATGCVNTFGYTYFETSSRLVPHAHPKRNDMKVVFATLAEYAKVDQEQRFSISGGDVRELRVGALSTLALAARLQFDPEDLGVDRIVDIISTGPAGQQFVRPYSLVVRAEIPDPNSGPVTFPFVYTMEDVRIDQPGQHTVLIKIAGSDLAAIHFTAIGSVRTDDKEVPAWAPSLEASLKAFGEGDLDRSHGLLIELTTGFPDLAIGHNNLGFVKLVMGRPHEALPEFERAVQLQFDRPEVLIANIGVCRYLIGDPVGAQSLFRFCLTKFSFMQGAWLMGLHDDHAFLQMTHSALNYVELVSLNDAWSSYRLGDVGGAREACARISTSAMAKPPTSFFAVSVRDLGSRLH